jgi:apolipoprotein N-acyltransferase
MRVAWGVGLAVLSGGLVTLAWPQNGPGWLILVAGVPMLVAQHHVLPARLAGVATALTYGIASASLAAVVGEPDPPGPVVVWGTVIAIAIGAGAVGQIERRLWTRIGYRWWIAAGPLAWGLQAMVRLRLPFAGSDGFLALGLFRHPLALQPVSVVGIIGLEIAIVLVNVVLAALVMSLLGDERFPRVRARRLVVGLAAGLAVWLGWSLALLDDPPRSLRVAAVQPAVDEGWFAYSPGNVVSSPMTDRLTGLTEQAADDGAQLVVWPEYGLPFAPCSPTNPDHAPEPPAAAPPASALATTRPARTPTAPASDRGVDAGSTTRANGTPTDDVGAGGSGAVSDDRGIDNLAADPAPSGKAERVAGTLSSYGAGSDSGVNGGRAKRVDGTPAGDVSVGEAERVGVGREDEGGAGEEVGDPGAWSAAEVARDNGVFIVAGYGVFGELPADDSGAATGGPADGFLDRNEAVLITPDGECLGPYAKQHPVRWIGESSDTDFGTPTFPTDLGRLATVICYDLDFTDVSRAMAADGAQLVAAPSEDWSAMARYHIAPLVFRSVENGVATVKADQRYDSAVIDPHGRIVDEVVDSDGRSALVVADVALGSGRRTFWNRHAGHLELLWLAAAATIAALVLRDLRRAGDRNHAP